MVSLTCPKDFIEPRRLSFQYVRVCDRESLIGLRVMLHYFWRVVPASGVSLETEWSRSISGLINPLASCLYFSHVSTLSLN